jgi:hypothetical protein
LDVREGLDKLKEEQFEQHTIDAVSAIYPSLAFLEKSDSLMETNLAGIDTAEFWGLLYLLIEVFLQEW